MSGRGAAMCCVFLAACTAGGTRDADTIAAADTALASVQVARGADSVPAASSTPILKEGDTVVTLGMVERDLTGDGRPEVLRLTGVGQPSDSLDVTLVIESSGDTLFQTRLLPLTRTVGFDAGRRKLSHAEYHTRLDEYGGWFFGDGKFLRPTEFVEQLRSETPGRIADIPFVITRDRQRQLFESLRAAGHPVPEPLRNPSLSREWLDTADAVAKWERIKSSGVTVFTYSPGGDTVYGIVWSARDRRFYRVWECC